MAEAEMELKYNPGEGCTRFGRYGYGWDGTYESVCCDRPVGKETFELQQRISRLESENSLLKSENDSERKMVELYKDLNKKISENEDKDRERWEKQLVHNARQDVRLEVLERDVHQLYSMTGLYVEARHVTPRPMPRYNNFEVPITNEETPIA